MLEEDIMIRKNVEKLVPWMQRKNVEKWEWTSKIMA